MKIETLARTTSVSLAKHTKKNWDEWIALLDSRGARLLSRKEIVGLLRSKYKVTPWWQQIIASGYEQVIGRRIEGQNAKGLYSVGATRTLYVSSKKAWSLLTSDEGIELWLAPFSPVDLKPKQTFENSGFDGEGAFGEIRVVTAGKQIRFRWQDPEWEKPSTCLLGVLARDSGKCFIGFSQTDLPTTRVKEQARVHWQAVLDHLSEAVRVAAVKPKVRK